MKIGGEGHTRARGNRFIGGEGGITYSRFRVEIASRRRKVEEYFDFVQFRFSLACARAQKFRGDRQKQALLGIN